MDPAHSALAPYLRSAPVWRCPADTPTHLDRLGRVGLSWRSYDVNVAVGTKPDAPGPTDGISLNGPLSHNSGATGPWRTYGRLSDINLPGPSDLYFIVEVHPMYAESIPALFVSMNKPTVMYGFPTTRHSFGAMFSYADGHSQIHRWMDPRTGKVPAAGWPPPLSDARC